jgi:hypothetical protein
MRVDALVIRVKLRGSFRLLFYHGKLIDVRHQMLSIQGAEKLLQV